MNNVEIAGIIAQQMGGTGRLKAMVGAMNFVAHENGLTFKFKGNRQFTHCKVTLNGKDLYDMEFIRVRGTTITKVAEYTDVYNDQLISLFQDTTGLFLRF